MQLLRKVVPYAAVPVVLYAVPVSVLDSIPSVCLFKNFFGAECPGCGMTRAFICILHFRFAEAFDYNRLILIVFPVSIFLFVRSLIRSLRSTSI